MKNYKKIMTNGTIKDRIYSKKVICQLFFTLFYEAKFPVKIL